ncbi:MAG: NAD(P)H-hydrate dehydratase [Deltaproteobacteria bacterium]|jgi:NAD(P)H-hydrate epimerase|nr:NAD(P)H-hydrate dehydratase [Deltaproteobacteria bacterium]
MSLGVDRIPREPGKPRCGVFRLVSAAQMQALDRRTIDEQGISGEILMESAGRALVAPVLALRAASARPEQPIRAICGAGNNGGDGFVLVRHLQAEGIEAEAILIGDPARLPPDAAANWQRLAVVGAAHRVAAEGLGGSSLLEGTSVAVDAIFGTGLQRPVEGRLAETIEALRHARGGGLRVLSVDVPSGISADTGAVLGTAVEADVTITISLPKIGLTLEPGRSHAGEVRVARIGIADPEPDEPARVESWTAKGALERMPARPRAGHKGSFGHVLVVAGSAGKTGAAALCARAASRAGAGLVTVAFPRGLEVELSGLCVEAMSASLATASPSHFDPSAEKAIVELAAARDVMALGPGFGREPETGELVQRLVTGVDRPLVIDADGLFALHGQLELVRERRAPTVLTPHPGEAAHLLDSHAGKINADRLAAARDLAARSGAAVVLKGAGTVVADPSGRALVVPTGGPALASGGTGDVLTGIVAALLAAGLPALEAGGLAAWWHGATADRLAAGRVDFGLLASELADGLPDAAAALRERVSLLEAMDDEGLALRYPGT